MNKKGVWISLDILKCNDISLSNKILLAEIYNLTKLEKGCTQTDKGFAEILHVSNDVINRGIRTLAEKGYITKSLNQTSNGSKRTIKPTAKITSGRPRKSGEPTAEIRIAGSDFCIPLITNKKTKKKNIKKVTSTLPSIKEDMTLYKSIEAAFLSKTGKFTNYPKEGKSIKGLIKKAENWAPDDPGTFIKGMITRYYEERINDKFIGKQPFTPSALNSDWLFDRMMIPLETRNSSIPEDLEFLFEEKQDESRNILEMG